MQIDTDTQPVFRSDLRGRLAAMTNGQVVTVPAGGVKWEALNTARKRAAVTSGLKYQIKRIEDLYFVSAYDPSDMKPGFVSGKASQTNEALRELIRGIVREELAAAK